MRVNIMLGGNLRNEGTGGLGERILDVPNGSQVKDLIHMLGLASRRVRLILLNGRGATLDALLADGDRVGLFPPELSFNTFVSLSFREERVEARERAAEGGEA